MSETTATAAQIVRSIDREGVITYKKKDAKSSLKSVNDEQDGDSAPSNKTASHSEQPIMQIIRRHPQSPLPELNRERRKILGKNLEAKSNFSNEATTNKSGSSASSGYVQKQVRQHDNILLKQRNNLLASQNMKLKTRIMALEKDNSRLEKTIEVLEPSRITSATGATINQLRQREKFKGQNTIKMAMRGVKKQLEELRKENTNIKSSVKFTTIRELELERDELRNESIRLRQMLEEQQNRRAHLKMNYQGMTTMESKLSALQERTSNLMRENSELLEKCKKMEESVQKVGRLAQNQKNLNKMLFNARRVIKEKQKQVEILRTQMHSSGANKLPQTFSNNLLSIPNIPSNTNVEREKQKIAEQNKNQARRQSVDKARVSVGDRTQSKSAQKYGHAAIKTSIHTTCQSCAKKQKQINELNEKIKKLQVQLTKVSNHPHGAVSPTAGNNNRANPSHFSLDPKQKPTPVELQELSRFLTLRFKAHRLSYEESQKYLINSESTLSEHQLSEEKMTVRQLMESLFVQPFSIVSSRYLEILVIVLAYGGFNEAAIVNIDQAKQIKKSAIIESYHKFLKQYEIISQQKQEEMFIQIAELITNYYQQVLAALNGKKNGQGTISEIFFREFFKQIELEEEYIDFIITQVILESLDLQHLNFYAMFEIFYMPNTIANSNQNPAQTKGNKFAVDHSRIVQEEDQQYEQSKSHLGSRHKTLEKKQQDEEEGQGEDQKYYEQQFQKTSPKKNIVIEDDEYEEAFEQEKMNNQDESARPASKLPYTIEDVQE